jgi:hypothetical protein
MRYNNNAKLIQYRSMLNIPNFCLPNTTTNPLHPSEGYGWGCGNGICAEDGSHCICDPGWAYGVYFQTYPDCWETSEIRSILFGLLYAADSLLILLCLLCILHSKKAMKTVAMYNLLGALFLLGTTVACSLEGYVGLATFIFLTLEAFATYRAVSLIIEQSMQAVLLSHTSRVTVKRILLFCSVGFSVLDFIGIIVAYPSGSIGDWSSYNKLHVFFFWGLWSAIVLFIILPLSLANTRFADFVQNLDDQSRDEEQKKKLFELVDSLKFLRNVMVLASIPLGGLALYCTIAAYIYGQVPLRNMVFFLSYSCPLLVGFGVCWFLLAIYGRNTRRSSKETISERNIPSKETSSTARGSKESLAVISPIG